MNIVTDHIQKILGVLAAISGAVVSFAAAGGLNEIVAARELQILGLINVILGAATAGSGFANTAKLKAAQAIETAIRSSPPTQAGFSKIALLCILAALSLPVLTISGCATAQQIQELPFERRLQLAVDTHAEVTRQVTAALDAQQISSKVAMDYLELAEGSRKVLDEARALQGVDLSSADAQLRLANDLLLRLRAYLIARESK